MKKFKTILFHELQQMLYNFKFVLLLVISILITVICAYIQIIDFKERQASYDEEVRNAENLKKNFKVYSEFQIPVLIPPNPLSIFAKGVDEEVGNKVIVSIPDLPEFQTTAEKSNPFMAIFSYFDVIDIIKILFSIMVILMVADSISGERDAQTLKLVFVNNIGKFEYFGIKYLGALIMAIIPLTIVFIISTLMVVLQPFIAVDYLFWIKILFLFISCVFFISVFVLLGLLVSAKATSAEKSIMMGVFIWLLLFFIYPNTVNYVINAVVEKPSKIELNEDIAQIEENFIRNDLEWLFQNHHGQPTTYTIANGFDFLPLSGFLKFIALTEKYEFELQEQHVKTMIPKFIEEQQKILNLKDEYHRKMLHPIKISNIFTFFIPDYLISNASVKIAGTDRYHRQEKLKTEVRNYRNTLIDYLKTKGAIGLKFFTQVKPEDMKDNIEDYSNETKEKYNNIDEYRRISTDDAPQFNYKSGIVLPFEIGVIVLLNLILFVFGAKLFINSSLIEKN